MAKVTHLVDETENEEMNNFGCCTFCGQVGNTPSELSELSKEDKNKYVSNNCSCFEGEHYRKTIEQQKLKNETMMRYKLKTKEFLQVAEDNDEYLHNENMESLLDKVADMVFDENIDSVSIKISSRLKAKVCRIKGKLCLSYTLTDQTTQEI